jgi:signal transduction histidine kinase
LLYNVNGWGKVKRIVEFSPQWIFYIVAGCFYGAVFLRSFLRFQNSSDIFLILGLQLVSMALAVSESSISRRWKYYFPVYLALEVSLIIYLFSLPDSADFFGILLMVPTMQIMLRYDPLFGWLWIAACAFLMGFSYYIAFGSQIVAVAIVNTAGNIFFGSYALITRRAQLARVHNQALALELEDANHQLRDYVVKLEHLAVAKERNRLARELHDSVTQTVFSMTLTVQSALLLYERDPRQVEPQLERLSLLANRALSEMQILIAELSPEKEDQGGLMPALQKHIANCQSQQDLEVVLDVDGNGSLNLSEEQGLFRIAQEALNNVVKHAHTQQAHLGLHLSEPFWMEISDQGQGFTMEEASDRGKIGLHSMQERAAEIGWDIKIMSSPGSGTRVRVEKLPVQERQAS